MYDSPKSVVSVTCYCVILTVGKGGYMATRAAMTSRNKVDIIRLGISSPNPLTLEGSARLWSSVPGIEIREAFKNSVEIRHGLANRGDVDVILCANSLWLEVFRSLTPDVIAESRQWPRIVIMGPDDPAACQEMFDRSASGYVPYTAGFDELVDVVKLAARGYWAMPGQLLGSTDTVTYSWRRFGSLFTGVLSPREFQITYLVATGLHDKQIATTLNFSVRSVQGMVGTIFDKLKVESRVQLAVLVWTGSHRPEIAHAWGPDVGAVPKEALDRGS